jgi:hypothetical protein
VNKKDILLVQVCGSLKVSSKEKEVCEQIALFWAHWKVPKQDVGNVAEWWNSCKLKS